MSLEHSHLAQHATQQALLKKIELQPQPLCFADFMKFALYTPGLGYYSAGMQKLGPQGDFVTAPECSSLFSYCIAAQCQAVLAAVGEQACILELGPGSGRMALDILSWLPKEKLPRRYYFLEISAELKARQQQLIQENCPERFQLCRWLSTLPTEFEGIILANEVIDAMPVHLFQLQENGTILEGMVQKKTEWELVFRTPTTPFLESKVRLLQARLPAPLPPYYTSEILLTLDAWLASLNACLKKGVMLFIDYGFPSHEYYHPTRTQGTLMCHTQHKAHSDPLQNIGLQDITAHVDFTALAIAAQRCDLQLAGFTNQANFLLANGLLEHAKVYLESPREQANLSYKQTTRTYSLAQQVQTLTAPHEMGELFKVMALSKALSLDLQGFSLRSHAHRLFSHAHEFEPV